MSGGRWLRAAILLALLAVWVLLPHGWEGPVVWSLSDTHGVHLTDLVGAALVAVGGWLWLR